MIGVYLEDRPPFFVVTLLKKLAADVAEEIDDRKIQERKKNFVEEWVMEFPGMTDEIGALGIGCVS